MLNILGVNMNENGSKRWRKILYEDQGVPDNYVDESFLDEMKKNCAWDILKVLSIICVCELHAFLTEPRPLQ